MKRLPSNHTVIALILSGLIIAVVGLTGARALAQPLMHQESRLTVARPQLGRGAAQTDVNASPALTATVYLPIIFRPPSIDLSIASLEATQSVQTESNSVPMVAGRMTVLRVYATVNGVPSLSGVQVYVSGTRDGAALPGSPLLIGPGTVPISPSRGLYASTFNVQLPAAWTTGLITLTAKVDPVNSVIEANEGNNTASLVLEFNALPLLDIMIVRVNYTDMPTGQFYPAPSVDTISDWIMRSYPVSTVRISWHPMTINYTADLKNNLNHWKGLLEQVTTLREAEDPPQGQIFYGFVSIKNSTNNWLGSGGVVGMGWIGYRAAVGLDLTGGGWGADSTGQTAAHEIGHSFGRKHAPCGDPANPDSGYPYLNAVIGQYGLDIPKAKVWAPDTTYDLMSYCSPQWLSDYTYVGLYNDQISNGLMAVHAPPTEVLLIRAGLDEDAPVLSPVYSLRGTPSALPASSEYAVDLLDGEGHVVASHPVAALVAEEPGVTARAIHARVPRPTQPVARVRLVRGGATVAERWLSESATASSVTLDVERSADAVTLHWGAPNIPALVRYTLDDGQTWTTVGVDILGGQLTLDSRWLPADTLRFEVRLADNLSASSIVFTP